MNDFSPHGPGSPYPEPYRPMPMAVQRWTAGAERALTIPVGEARLPILQALRALGFASTTEQYGVLEAERGSKLRGLSMTRSRVPVGVRVTFGPVDDGCRLDIRIEDRWSNAGRTPTVVAVYAEVFTEVLAALDDKLTRVDPKGAEGFPPWWRTLPENQAAAGAAGFAASSRLESAVGRGSARVLEGPRRSPSSAVVNAGVHMVVFSAPGVMAEFEPEVVDSILVVGQLIASAPGAMPAGLVKHLQTVVLMLEQRLDAYRQSGHAGNLWIEVTAADRPVLTFLAQQAALREKLPVRTLFTCTTCRLEKVINPDFVRLRERTRRLRVLQTSVGAVIGSHQVSPFILLGRLAQLKKSDPDYVCLRCQGTDADEKPITFCSRCGERLNGSVLRTCPKCALDLRTLLGEFTVWNEIEAPPVPVVPEPIRLEPGATVTDPANRDVATPDTEGGPSAAPPNRSPGWYPDPWTRFEVRFWDGDRWTMHVGSGGLTSIDTQQDPAPSIAGPLPVPPPPSDDVTHVKRPF